MIDELKSKVNEAGWKGRAFVRGENSEEVPKAIQAVFEMDEEYLFAVSIQEGFKAPEDTPVISFAGDAAAIQTALDNAIMEGLGHSKMLKEKETGAIIRFGYTLEDIFGK